MTIEVIWENGVLKPLQPLNGLREHQRLHVTVQPVDALHQRAGRFARFAGTMTADEAREMEQLVENEFEKLDGKEPSGNK